MRFRGQTKKKRALARRQRARPPLDCCCSVAPAGVEGDSFGHLPLGLVKAAADSLAAAGREQASEREKPKPALESVVANDLLAAGTWRVRRGPKVERCPPHQRARALLASCSFESSPLRPQTAGSAFCLALPLRRPLPLRGGPPPLH